MLARLCRVDGHRLGIVAALAGVLLISSDGLLVKLAGISGASAASIVIFKGLFGASMMLGGIVCRRVAEWRAATPAAPLEWAPSREGLRHIVIGAFLAAFLFIGFTLSFHFTTSANVLAFTALSPIWASLLTKPVLGEPLLWRTIIANAGALVGTAIVVTGVALRAGDAVATSTSVLGTGLAILTGIASGFYYTTIRSAHTRAPGTSMIYAPALGLVLATGFGLALIPVLHDPAKPLVPSGMAMVWIFVNGAFCVATAIGFVTLAATLAPPAEVSLVMQLEGLLGPLSTFIVLNEVPTVFTLCGGLVVLTCVIGHEALMFVSLTRQAREAKAAGADFTANGNGVSHEEVLSNGNGKRAPADEALVVAKV